jgi:hypothetical protein
VSRQAHVWQNVLIDRSSANLDKLAIFRRRTIYVKWREFGEASESPKFDDHYRLVEMAPVISVSPTGKKIGSATSSPGTRGVWDPSIRLCVGLQYWKNIHGPTYQNAFFSSRKFDSL